MSLSSSALSLPFSPSLSSTLSCDFSVTEAGTIPSLAIYTSITQVNHPSPPAFPSHPLPTGQSPALFQLPDPIDRDTPKEAQSRVGFDGQQYELVFSDEFNQDGRSFYPGDDPFWEASELLYGQTRDLEWHDHQQIATLVIALDSADALQPHLTPGLQPILLSIFPPFLTTSQV
jgi:hypothetical protein